MKKLSKKKLEEKKQLNEYFQDEMENFDLLMFQELKNDILFMLKRKKMLKIEI